VRPHPQAAASCGPAWGPFGCESFFSILATRRGANVSVMPSLRIVINSAVLYFRPGVYGVPRSACSRDHRSKSAAVLTRSNYGEHLPVSVDASHFRAVSRNYLYMMLEEQLAPMVSA